MKVVVKNYQSIADATLEVEGFTAVTGKTNTGKSALVRALSAACYGHPGDHYVREGKDQAAVGMWLDDGTELKWYKVPTGKKSPGRETMLVINGQKHTKLGKEHHLVTEPLGFKTIDTTLKSLRPQVAGQWDGVFLLAENESTVAEAFKVLGRGDVVAKARDLAKKDWGKVAVEINTREEDASGKKKGVEGLQWVLREKERWTALHQAASVVERKVLTAEKAIEGIEFLRVWKEERIPEVPRLLGDPVLLRKVITLRTLQVQALPKVPVVTLPEDSKVWVKIKSLLKGRLEEQEAEQAVQEKEKEMERLGEDLKSTESQLGYCPVCRRRFDVDGTAGHTH